ncbi:NADH dehydrogenase [ubiquinone] 1 beta subcomplex subunit 8, mitochondrial [Armadillidium nasatum]|uniref:NADH dehydrogenase [ubiquinone] 1 beta subcomplex subunit 8, mitochondrial n=1 Tax=Armadillidium nasatum TaxID=96803 RepID=A0A5N5SQL7_9CRUS|nr:NADH dehydrogenase [ubiquinone] 1 beta subcomplex subunit 8, mitochondrial [Armadillidium nasatum]
MSNLIKCIKKGVILNKNSGLIVTTIRHAGAWNRDWKPGPYPTTQEEREAAAKKYGLHIRDYKPYPDDGFGWGDYPMFEPLSVESGDPYEHWDMPEYKRNLGDLMHPNFDFYIAERYDISKRSKSYFRLLGEFLAIMSVMSFICYYAETHKVPKPKMHRQYPEDGKKHYTFEPVE